MSFLRKNAIRSQEKQLLKKIKNLDHADEVVTVMPTVTSNQLVQMGAGKYTPPFKAQIQLQVLKKYFSENAGTYTGVLPASVPAGLQQMLPVFVFGQIDFEAGYAKNVSNFPVNNWSFDRAFIYGKDYPAVSYGALDSTVKAALKFGDLVLAYVGASGGTNYLALQIVRAADVPFASLLAATSSNTFDINMIRYSVDSGKDTQFANALYITDETMFGRFSTDAINPESFKNPEQQQTNIVDIDAEISINKQKGISTYVNYDVENFRLNLFIASATKIV